MKTLTAITNQSTVTAVQNIQALIAQLNEAVERDPNGDLLKCVMNNFFDSPNEDLELTITGYINYFNVIFEEAQNPDTKSSALRLRDIFKLFQD